MLTYIDLVILSLKKLQVGTIMQILYGFGFQRDIYGYNKNINRVQTVKKQYQVFNFTT
jgi:hypothetical protein